MRKLRGKLSYANVVATLALCLVVAGGSAFAATKLGKNTVGTKQLQRNAVTGAKIKNGSVSGDDLANDAIKTVPNATNAAHADSATIANSATTATSAGSAGTAETAGTATNAANAANLAGFARKGSIRVSASAAGTFEAGEAGAPQTDLFSAGPFTVYAQCFTTPESKTYGVISIRTSLSGSIFEATDELSGSPAYLDTDTAPGNREIEYETAEANKANIGYEDFDAMAPDGTAVNGQVAVAVKNGNPPAGNGAYGPGNVCLFEGNMTTLSG